MSAKLISMDSFSDARGSLFVAEFPKNLPFAPFRFFVVSGVPQGESRGNHAHKTNEQILYSLDGSVKVRVNDGKEWSEFTLRSGSEGLYIPPIHWGEQVYESENARLLVMASEPYSADEYINGFDNFLRYSLEHSIE